MPTEDPGESLPRENVVAEKPTGQPVSVLWHRIVTMPSRLGTVAGVFGPTVLMMVGAILFLRHGWVVGHAGILGGVLLVAITFSVVGLAALSLTSLSTNARSGAPGTAGILVDALGLETGSVVGLAIFLAQAVHCGIFLYAFAEAWLYLFPSHPMMLVAYGALGLVLILSVFAGDPFLLRLHTVALAIVAMGLISMLFGASPDPVAPVAMEPGAGGFPEGVGFWVLFAVFFPAATGIEVGGHLSNRLAEPRKSLPRGVLSAIMAGFTVYVIATIWYGKAASPAELRSDYLIAAGRSAWAPAVMGAVLVASLAAAFTSMSAARRSLQVLGGQGWSFTGVLGAAAAHHRLARTSFLATGSIVAIVLLLGGLDRIALLTCVLYLFVHLALHVLVFAEGSLGVTSHRPALRIPRAVPVVGAVLCLIILSVIGPVFALLAVTGSVALYAYLNKRSQSPPRRAARSNLHVAMAYRAIRGIERNPEWVDERVWTPRVLVPVESMSQLDPLYRFLRLITEPMGSLQLMGVRRIRAGASGMRGSVTGMADPGLFGPRTVQEELAVAPEPNPDDQDVATPAREELESLELASESLRSEAMAAAAAMIEAPNLLTGVDTAVRISRGFSNGPNILLGLAHVHNQETLQGLVNLASENRMGVVLLYLHPETALGYERTVNVWMADPDADRGSGLQVDHMDLALHIARLVSANLNGRLRLSVACSDARDVRRANEFLDRLVYDARLPAETEKWVGQGSLIELMNLAPRADIHVVRLVGEVQHAYITMAARRTGGTCLFVRGSGRESIFA